MFFTQPSAELHPPLPFDLKIKRWAVVEQDLENPWFHVCIKMTEEEMEFGRTLLVSDVEYLERVLNEVSPFGSVCSVMVMTPPRINASAHWRMEHVLAINTVPDEPSGQPHVRLTVEHGKTYDLFCRKTIDQTGALPQCIYSAPQLE
ncbi:hypothetical protein [Pseudomonas prosekii]|uniref:hypothetical protein n=1 Tax=Pseudomonas prosekii TaxID=1148509 RepID=UPI003F754D6D